MASEAAIVYTALKAANVPIVSVAIGNPADRATWRIDFDPTATPAQKTQGATILASVVIDAAAVADADAMDAVDLKVLKAVSRALWEAIPAPTMTLVQLRARAIQIWKSL